jgi:hypothetical protein
MRQIFEIQCVHGALKPYMELTDLALGESDNLDGPEGELLIKVGCVGLVARKPIESLRHHDVKSVGARIFKQLLIAWPKRGSAAHRVICVGT